MVGCPKYHLSCTSQNQKVYVIESGQTGKRPFPTRFQIRYTVETMSPLHIHLLGSFQVLQDGRSLTGFRTDKIRALLAYLAVESDRPHRRDTLAALFWPDMDDQKARYNLYLTQPHHNCPASLSQFASSA